MGGTYRIQNVVHYQYKGWVGGKAAPVGGWDKDMAMPCYALYTIYYMHM